MTADERIEKLLNRFGQTISDLPATKDNDWSGPGYAIDHLKAAKKAAYVWMWEEYEDADVIPIDEIEPPLLDYICHLADVIDRMEIALCTAQRVTACNNVQQRVTTCKSCQHHKALLAKDWDNVSCSECNSSQCRMCYQISDEYLSDINQNEAETILKGRSAE